MNRHLQKKLIPDYAGNSADSYYLSVLGLTSLVLGMAQLLFMQYSHTISGIYLSFTHRGRPTYAEAIFLTLMLPMMATIFGGLGLYLSTDQKLTRAQGSGLCWAGFALGLVWMLIQLIILAM